MHALMDECEDCRTEQGMRVRMAKQSAVDRLPRPGLQLRHRGVHILEALELAVDACDSPVSSSGPRDTPPGTASGRALPRAFLIDSSALTPVLSM